MRGKRGRKTLEVLSVVRLTLTAAIWAINPGYDLMHGTHNYSLQEWLESLSRRTLGLSESRFRTLAFFDSGSLVVLPVWRASVGRRFRAARVERLSTLECAAQRKQCALHRRWVDETGEYEGEQQGDAACE